MAALLPDLPLATVAPDGLGRLKHGRELAPAPPGRPGSRDRPALPAGATRTGPGGGRRNPRRFFAPGRGVDVNCGVSDCAETAYGDLVTTGPCVEDSELALTKDRKTEVIGVLPHARVRHRLTGSPGRHPERAHQLPDRALQDPREGPPLAPRPAEAGRPAPTPARLPEAEGCGALRGADPQARDPEVGTGPSGSAGQRTRPARPT